MATPSTPGPATALVALPVTGGPATVATTVAGGPARVSTPGAPTVAGDPARGSGGPATVRGFSLFIPSERVLKLKRKMDRTSDVAASAMAHRDEADEMFEEASNIAREAREKYFKAFR